MFAERKSVTLVTDDQGDAVGYIDVPHGRAMSLHYAKVDFADGVDFTVTAEATGEGLWTESDVNASKSVYPRAAISDQVGGAATYDGTNEIYEPILLANDRIKIVVASGGDTTSGVFMAVIA